MKKTLKHVFSISFYILLSLVFVLLLLFVLLQMGLLGSFTSVPFDKSKLQYVSSNLQVYDNNDNLVKEESYMHSTIDVSELPRHVVDAFVSIEDKKFYSHNGLNYGRIVKACLNNLKSFRIKEGASTISQQLIKNTHLTSKKTFRRKFDEIVLTKQLEKELSKDEIMTSYLNAIYFGNGAFGISSASERYFSKQPKDLYLEESALLAGIIKSPKLYSPTTNKEMALKRRNIVLKEMLNDNKISLDEYNKAKDKPIKLNLSKNYLGENDYYNLAVSEACKTLKINEKDFILKNYKIKTYLDSSLQKVCRDSLDSLENNSSNIDGSVIILDNKTGGIKAFASKCEYNVLSMYRQPGSVFKPVISYAPALDGNLISPSTLVLDEKTNFDGYSPKNYNDVYHGWVSAKEALAGSYNVPSVKFLSYLGVENGKKFAENMGITFDKNDNGYSLALGGMTKGVKLLDMANCYQCFANNGNYIQARFVKEIISPNGEILFKNNELETRCMKESTAFLITDMLKESVNSGTCKKLNIKGNVIAAKTGTVGKGKNEQNSDVWSISYTPQNTLCVWCGGANGNPLDKSITGANTPTNIAQYIYKNYKLSSGDFSIPKSVQKVDLNTIDYYQKNKVAMASPGTPDRYKMSEYFAVDNLPKEVSNIFDTMDKLEINAQKIDGNKVEITFNAKNYLTYKLYRKSDDNVKILCTYENKNGKLSFIDEGLPSGNFYTYYIQQEFSYNPENDAPRLSKGESNYVMIFVA